MKIAIGADHRGNEVRVHLVSWLAEQQHEVQECGPCSRSACDYPDAAYAVSIEVASGRCERGILACGSGIGTSMAANKVKGARAALVHDEIGAEISRRHNDANVLCLAADMLGQRIINRIVQTWLNTDFEGGRHLRRVQKISAIEHGVDPSASDSPAMVDEKM